MREICDGNGKSDQEAVVQCSVDRINSYNVIASLPGGRQGGTTKQSRRIVEPIVFRKSD